MATTVAVIEILVVGFFATTWLLVFIAYAADVGWDSVRYWATNSKDWSAAVTAGVALAIYQLGWLINGVSRALMWPLAKRVLNYLHTYHSVPAERVRATVYYKGSPAILEDLALDQSVIRLDRAGIVNFSVTSLLLFWIGKPVTIVAIVFLALFVLCTLQWWHRNWRYYERLIDAYQVIVNGSNSTWAQPRRGKPRWRDFLRSLSSTCALLVSKGS